MYIIELRYDYSNYIYIYSIMYYMLYLRSCAGGSMP